MIEGETGSDGGGRPNPSTSYIGIPVLGTDAIPVEVIGGVEADGLLQPGSVDDLTNSHDNLAYLRNELKQQKAHTRVLRAKLVKHDVSKSGVDPDSTMGQTIIRNFDGLYEYASTFEEYQALRTHMADFLDDDVVDALGLVSDMVENPDPDEVSYWRDRHGGAR